MCGMEGCHEELPLTPHPCRLTPAPPAARSHSKLTLKRNLTLALGSVRYRFPPPKQGILVEYVCNTRLVRRGGSEKGERVRSDVSRCEGTVSGIPRLKNSRRLRVRDNHRIWNSQKQTGHISTCLRPSSLRRPQGQPNGCIPSTALFFSSCWALAGVSGRIKYGL